MIHMFPVNPNKTEIWWKQFQLRKNGYWQ